MFAGSDLSGRTRGNYVVGAGAQVADDGTFTAEVALNGFSEPEQDGRPAGRRPVRPARPPAGSKTSPAT